MYDCIQVDCILNSSLTFFWYIRMIIYTFTSKTGFSLKVYNCKNSRIVQFFSRFHFLIIIMNLAWNWLGNNWITTVYFAFCRYVASFLKMGEGADLFEISIVCDKETKNNLLFNTLILVWGGGGCKIPALLNSPCFLHAPKRGDKSLKIQFSVC